MEKFLTYKNKSFVLCDHGRESNVPLKEALHLESLWDLRAKKIFNRVLVKKYEFKRELPPYLDTHQIAGVRWILTRSRSYLAHAPGAGKTCEAITASFLTPHVGQVLFVVPPAATVNWAREIEMWSERLSLTTPEIEIIPDSAHKDDANFNAEFIICPDSMLTRPWVLMGLLESKKRLVAVDEASRFKDPEAQRTIALFGGELKSGMISPGLCQSAAHAVLLDGSPMPNRPMELWAPVIALSPATIDFATQDEFGMKYCGPTMGYKGRMEYKRSSNEVELRERLQKSFMHVVTEEELEHPERLRSILFMDEDARSPEQRAWERKNLSTINFSDLSEDDSQGVLAKYRHDLGLAKVDWVSNYVSERLQSKNESILLFAWHRDVVLSLAERLLKYDPGVVFGGTDSTSREKAFEAFQKGKKKVIVLNIASGGRIHNLQRADRVVFGEYSWNDETNKQCEKRASRRGRSKELPVRADYVVSPGTMDEPILQAVMRKAQTIRKIIG